MPNARIDAAGEDVPIESRQRDGSAKWNAGLPGVIEVVGARPDGKPKTAYRPRMNHEVSSNRNAREIAKRNNLTPIEGGRYRPLPK